MNADEKSLPWWKSDRFFNSVFPALLVALLIYSLVRADQQLADMNAQIADLNARMEAQFAAQTMRIDSLFLQLGDLKAARAVDGERLDRIEDMLRILIDDREVRIREQAQLSQ